MLNFLIGQKVISGKLGEDPEVSLFGFVFSGYELIVSCPWRIRNKDGILVGEPDLKYSKVTYKEVYDTLRHKQVTHVFLNETTADLTIEFEGEIYLDLFHVSGYFEAWELGELKPNGRDFVALPGGEIDEY